MGTSPSRQEVRVGAAAFLLVTLVVAASVWQVTESRAERRAQVLDEDVTTVRLVARGLGQELGGYRRLIEAFAHRPSLTDAVRRGDWPDTTRHLRDLRDLVPDFSSVVIVDRDGRVQNLDPPDPSAIGADHSTHPEFSEAARSNGSYLSDVAVEPEQEPSIAVSAVVRDPGGPPLSVLTAMVPVSALAVEARDFGVAGSLAVFDRAGHDLTRPEIPVTRSFASQPVVAEALAGRSGAGEVDVPGRKGRRLAAWAPVPGTGWAVVVDQPRGSAYGPLGGLNARLAGISALIVLAAGVGAVSGSRLLRRLERERSRSTAILASIADGVITVDADGRISSVNPAMEELMGYSEAELRGRLHADAISTFDERGRLIPQEERIVVRAVASGRRIATQGYGLSLLTRDGRRVPVSVAAAPIFDCSGEVLGGVAVTRDISDELEVDQLKSALVSTVSHELRTPLTMIRGFAELLTTRDLGEERSREALGQISVSAERLSRLIDDLLSVSRIESGRVVLHAVPVELNPAIQDALATLPPGREARVELDGVTAALADPDMLVQILTNLVSNAAKYSPPGSPVVVEARPSGASVEISVRDEGIGLSEAERAELFGKFYRVDRPEVSRVGGTGLGLYITKNLVEMQGGQIWVSSERGQGSTFTFTLPMPDSKEGS